MKRKNSHVFLLKKVGGALIRVGALNRDYTVILIRSYNDNDLSPLCVGAFPWRLAGAELTFVCTDVPVPMDWTTIYFLPFIE